jgi:asparagine synthase (glutamine-hydrolysing)
MCGIVGIISPHQQLVQTESIQTMMRALQHRGSNGSGYCCNSANTVGFGHQRLAIIDTTDKGLQPFHYLQYTLVFNGEIYNYIELKAQLQQKGYVFFTQTDTEVVAAAYDCWGNNCLQYFDGMFAFAITNNTTQAVFIARDRFGEKPLFYYVEYEEKAIFKRFIFASEIKAFWSIGIAKQVNGTMVLNYITLGYTQHTLKNTQTFYNNILSLPPGHFLTIVPKEGKVHLKRWYWFKPAIVNTQHKETVYEQLLELLTTSVIRRLRSDVAIGTSLSGGLDSSTIAAIILQQQQKLNTFSAVFPGFEKDESGYIQSFMKAYTKNALQPHFTTPTAKQWATEWQQCMHHQDEPVQSASIFTQWCIYKLAKQQGVTVVLDGQGADEILGGYGKYIGWHLQYLLRQNPSNFYTEKKLFTQNGFIDNFSVQRIAAAFFPEKAAKQLQQKAIQQQLHHPYIHGDFYSSYFNDDTLQKPVVKSVDDILYYDTFIHGLQTLLRYADRNSMAFGVEVRLPFLNHELVEFIFGLPPEMKLQQGFTKFVLRKAAEKILPNSIAWRTGKIGYEPPQQQWMQEPAIQAIIIASREKMVAKNILDKSILYQPIIGSSAHAVQAADFRYMSVAALL